MASSAGSPPPAAPLDGATPLFAEEELRGMIGVQPGAGSAFLDVTCGCTSRRYGDAVGTLRVLPSGELTVRCDCTPGCCEDKLTPAAFEKHSGREAPGRWKNTVWVIIQGEKVPLSKTALLKYYNQAAHASQKGRNGRPCHRDEFIRCSDCNKERRFHLRSKEECRAYHDAAAQPDWKCSDFTSYKITCRHDEERGSRKVLRGCTRVTSCQGCTKCVCFGCMMCRFSDCDCQTCTDFYKNSEV